jgi:hypothetical protein
MPFVPEGRVFADLEWDEDTAFDETGESGTNYRSLPRFVPLQPELYASHRDPWSIYSATDMLRIYLPEISISTGLVAAAGVLGGRLFSRFAGSTETLPILAGYLGVHGLFLALAYSAAKGNSSTATRNRMRKMLLGCFLLLTSHLLANGLVMAGG